MSSHDDRNEVKTYFKMIEISRWLSITPFEILIHLISILIFSILLTLTIDGQIDFMMIQPQQMSNGTAHEIIDSFRVNQSDQKPAIDWFKLFSVLFCADILNAYFCFIMILRMYINNQTAIHKIFWSLNFILLTGLFKYLIALKLNETKNLEWMEVSSPIFVLLQLFALKACQKP
ncbi:transmembrane protein 203 [Chironomus tepperi]|uniref:transmembrane protein 203 n=1 Tax=Chironomus tepperi TaxID=113505 RepID=UPI00391F743B